MVKTGSHLGAVRAWIQRKFCFGNGKTVLWGKHERISSYPSGHCDLYVDDLEQLSQDICEAVLQEYKVKPNDHRYKYVVFSDKGSPAFTDVDTSKEAWMALFKASGKVIIYTREEDSAGKRLGGEVINGTADEVRAWLRANEL